MICDEIPPKSICDQIPPKSICDQIPPKSICDAIQPKSICDAIPPKHKPPTVTADSTEEITHTEPETVTEIGAVETVVAANGETDVETAQQTDPVATKVKKAKWMKHVNVMAYMQHKNRILREAWYAQQARIALNRDQTQLLTIIVVSVIALLLSITAIATPFWACQSWGNVDEHYGLWNMCAKQARITQLPANGTESAIQSLQVSCVHQEWGRFKWSVAADRIDRVTAAQALMLAGVVFYAMSLIGTGFGYQFVETKTRSNTLRNMLVLSVCAQVLAFCMHLVGLFMFLLTDNISVSVYLLFGYFTVAIFSTNIINFFTIEFKCSKYRKEAI